MCYIRCGETHWWPTALIRNSGNEKKNTIKENPNLYSSYTHLHINTYKKEKKDGKKSKEKQRSESKRAQMHIIRTMLYIFVKSFHIHHT